MTGSEYTYEKDDFLHDNFFPIQEIPELNEEDATGLYISPVKLYKSHPLVVPMVTYPVNTGIHAAYTIYHCPHKTGIHCEAPTGRYKS